MQRGGEGGNINMQGRGPDLHRLFLSSESRVGMHRSLTVKPAVYWISYKQEQTHHQDWPAVIPGP